MTYNPDDFNEVVFNNLMENKNMNNVNLVDVTFLSLALADFGAATTYLVAHDYPVAAGLVVIGIVLVYLYHKFGSQPAS